MCCLIAEITPAWYDVDGRKVFRPDARRYSGFRPTFPIGRFVSQPLKQPCSDLNELRKFLSRCNYVSDQELFGKKEYWQPPDQFEESMKGDCEDFALWTWRQLMHMNYPARFVTGTSGRDRSGHAWVTFEKDGKHFLVEPLQWMVGLKLPRLSILSYRPRFSVVWDGRKISYYEHRDKKFNGSVKDVAVLLAEWFYVWTGFWLRIVRALGKRLVPFKSRQLAKSDISDVR